MRITTATHDLTGSDGRAQRTMRRHELTGRIALFAGSVVAALALMECAVRLIEPREVMRYYFMASDPIIHHRFIPFAQGHYKTTEFDVLYAINSHGLREKEFPWQKKAGVRRVLMLGDSFTEGDGVEVSETFSTQLQMLLDSLPSRGRWEIINAGVGSYSPVLEYLYLANVGLKLHPDLVVLNVDLSDVYDDINYSQGARFDDRGIVVAVSPAHTPATRSILEASLIHVKDFFKEHTRLYNFVRIRIDRYVEGIYNRPDTSSDISHDKYAMFRPGYRMDGHDWGLTFKYIQLIRDTLAANGIPLWVTVYPYGIQVDSQEWSSGRAFWGFTPDTVYDASPQKVMEEFCVRAGIPVINTCKDFVAASKTAAPLYFDYNGHWRPAGHAVMARRLFQHLAEYSIPGGDHP